MGRGPLPLLCAMACVLQVAPRWWAVMKQQLRSGGVWAGSGASGGPGGAQSTVPHCVSLASSQASVAELLELGAHTELTVAGRQCPCVTAKAQGTTQTCSRMAHGASGQGLVAFLSEQS